MTIRYGDDRFEKSWTNNDIPKFVFHTLEYYSFKSEFWKTDHHFCKTFSCISCGGRSHKMSTVFPTCDSTADPVKLSSLKPQTVVKYTHEFDAKSLKYEENLPLKTETFFNNCCKTEAFLLKQNFCWRKISMIRPVCNF